MWLSSVRGYTFSVKKKKKRRKEIIFETCNLTASNFRLVGYLLSVWRWRSVSMVLFQG